jgi:hypothetical protein
MTIRTDISVDWEASPRVITIAEPSTEITLQDLVDTCRYLENDMDSMDDPPLIAAAGKEALGGGVSVAITASLQNAVLAFEARPGPTWTICNVRGGNLVAVDSLGDPLFPIKSTAFVQVVMAASSSATLVATSIEIAQDVWDVLTAGHTNPGSFGEAVTSGGIAPSAIADAVWDAQTNQHTDAGSFGKLSQDSKTVIDDTNNDLVTAKAVIDEIKTDVDGLVINATAVLDLVQTLLKYSKNRTRVDQTAKTLTVYDDDTLTPIKVFDLKDFTGSPSYTEVAERMPQP